MKNFFIAAISMAFVSSAFAQLQPQGTWYLGTANAPEALNIFSDGLEMTPTLGYAVSDNVVLTLDFGIATTTDELYGLTRPDSAVSTEISTTRSHQPIRRHSYTGQPRPRIFGWRRQ